jgi:quercetin dioxygenase-like cupin family protein
MGLQVKRENVPEKKVVLKTGEGEGSMIIRQAYGNESSLLVASRPPGYHTRPHMHASEQINHVLEGEIWFFMEDKGYHCKKATSIASRRIASTGRGIAPMPLPR